MMFNMMLKTWINASLSHVTHRYKIIDQLNEYMFNIWFDSLVFLSDDQINNINRAENL